MVEHETKLPPIKAQHPSDLTHSGTLAGIWNFFAGAFLSLVVGVPVAMFCLERLADQVTTLVATLIVVLLIVVIAFAIFILFGRPIFSWVFKGASVSVESLVKSSSDALDNLVAGRLREASISTEVAVREAGAIYVWTRLHLRMITWTLALMFTIGTFIQAMLNFRQNELFTEQNRVIQNELHFFENQAEVDLRRQLDEIMSALMDSRVVSEVGAMIYAYLANDSDELHGVGKGLQVERVFVSSALRDQVRLERAVQIIRELAAKGDSRRGTSVSASDYLIVANALYESGRFHESEALSKEGLRSGDPSIVHALLEFNLARIRYADIASAQSIDAAREKCRDARLVVERLNASDAETAGFKALIDIFQSHKEIDVGQNGKARELINIATGRVGDMPNYEFSFRWRIESLAASAQRRLVVSDEQSQKSGQVIAVNPLWDSVQRQLYTAEIIQSEDDVLAHLRNEIKARELVDRLRSKVLSELTQDNTSLIDEDEVVPEAPRSPD